MKSRIIEMIEANKKASVWNIPTSSRCLFIVCDDQALIIVSNPMALYKAATPTEIWKRENLWSSRVKGQTLIF